MSFRHIRLEAGDDRIALLSLHRPEKRNALHKEFLAELDTAFTSLASDRSVGALIVHGGDSKAFAAGADILELSSLTATEAAEHSRFGQSVFRKLETLGKPSVAAVHGIAFGGGLELALACTFRIASESALFALPETRLGVIPGFGGTQRLPRLIGRSAALRMMLTAEQVNARQAEQLGLVSAVVAEDHLLPASRQLLQRMLANAPLALAYVLNTVQTGLNLSLDDGMRLESAMFGLAAGTADGAEGLKAFSEKRPAVFSGN